MHPEVAKETRRWLRYAAEDLQTARSLSESGAAPPRHAAWLAQQAAEKAVKAVLISLQIPFPFVHDLDRLVALVPAGWSVRETDADLARLSDFAVEARYPDDLPDVSRVDSTASVEDAARIVEAAEADLAPQLDRDRGAT